MNETMRPNGLLRSAAALVERALLALNTTEAPCTHCRTRLFEDTVQARLYEQLSDLPDKLQRAAGKLEDAAGNAIPSRGFQIARRQYLEYGPEAPTLETEALDLLAGLVDAKNAQDFDVVVGRARQFLKVAGVLVKS